jgi:hypothetical protein
MLDKTPGTADWYLDRLGRKIVYQQERYDKLEKYMIGDHPLPSGDQRYVKSLRELQRKARTNYFGLVTMAPVERMQVLGFRFGSTEGSDSDAAKIWQGSDMDYQSNLLHLTASVFGDGYVMVSSPNPETPDLPVITVEDPRYCAVELDPASPHRIIAACKMWEDSVAGQVLAVVYLPDSIHYYIGPLAEDIRLLDKPSLTNHLFVNSTSFTRSYSTPNPIGEVPIVRFAWRMTFQSDSLGEAEDVIDIQDRINAEILNRLIISRSQAYKQRMIAGVKLPDDKGRGRRPPFDPGADMLWMIQDANAKIYEFKEADITQLLKAIRDDVGDMAAITKTPPHYLLGEVVNVSGDALKAAETGLVSKTKQRMKSIGWGWKTVMRLCFRYLNDSRAKDVITQVIWDDPEVKSRAELADALVKETSAGVPLALAMQRAKFTPEEIEFAIAEKRKEEARQAALQASMAKAAGQQQSQQDSTQGGANQQIRSAQEKAKQPKQTAK